MRSVTYDGDIYDPSGSLSGGSKSQSSGFLLKMQQYKASRDELESRERRLDDIKIKLDSCQKDIKLHSDIKQKLELKQHEYTLLQEQLSTNQYSQVRFFDVFTKYLFVKYQRSFRQLKIFKIQSKNYPKMNKMR